MNFDEMQWLVTAGDLTYGPFDKDAAVGFADRLRDQGAQAVAWAAQAPDLRRLTVPSKVA